MTTAPWAVEQLRPTPVHTRPHLRLRQPPRDAEQAQQHAHAARLCQGVRTSRKVQQRARELEQALDLQVHNTATIRATGQSGASQPAEHAAHASLRRTGGGRVSTHTHTTHTRARHESHGMDEERCVTPSDLICQNPSPRPTACP
jgi:hypothetical protein